MLFPALQAAPRRWLLYPSLKQQRLKQESFRNCALKLAYPVLVSNAVIQGTLKRRYRFLPLHRRGEERRGEERRGSADPAALPLLKGWTTLEAGLIKSKTSTQAEAPVRYCAFQ